MWVWKHRETSYHIPKRNMWNLYRTYLFRWSKVGQNKLGGAKFGNMRNLYRPYLFGIHTLG